MKTKMRRRTTMRMTRIRVLELQEEKEEMARTKAIYSVGFVGSLGFFRRSVSATPRARTTKGEKGVKIIRGAARTRDTEKHTEKERDFAKTKEREKGQMRARG